MRAVSIALVVFSHLLGGRGFLPVVSPFTHVDLGNFGVRVFFVISGYLISSLLFHEIAKSHTVSLPKFYFRRAFRIFPAFYVNVAVVVALASVGWASLKPGDVLHAVTYTTNYHYDRAWDLGHMWSLAVEEQFYLLWPAILLFLGKQRGVAIAAVFVVLAPAIRLATYKLHLAPPEGISETFQTVGDSIAVGCVLAGWRDQLTASARYRAFQASPLFVLVPITALAAAVLRPHPLADYAVGQTTMNVCIALTVDWCIRHPEGRVGRFLNSAPLVYVGTLSYSIYLWQQFFLNHTSSAPFAVFPLNLALTAAAALASYYVVERPFLRWRERIEPHIFKKKPSAPAVSV